MKAAIHNIRPPLFSLQSTTTSSAKMIEFDVIIRAPVPERYLDATDAEICLR